MRLAEAGSTWSPRVRGVGCCLSWTSHHFCREVALSLQASELQTFVKNHSFHLRNNKLPIPCQWLFCVTSLLPSGLSEALLILIIAFSFCLFKNQKADRLLRVYLYELCQHTCQLSPRLAKGTATNPSDTVFTRARAHAT